MSSSYKFNIEAFYYLAQYQKATKPDTGHNVLQYIVPVVQSCPITDQVVNWFPTKHALIVQCGNALYLYCIS